MLHDADTGFPAGSEADSHCFTTSARKSSPERALLGQRPRRRGCRSSRSPMRRRARVAAARRAPPPCSATRRVPSHAAVADPPLLRLGPSPGNASRPRDASPHRPRASARASISPAAGSQWSSPPRAGVARVPAAGRTHRRAARSRDQRGADQPARPCDEYVHRRHRPRHDHCSCTQDADHSGPTMSTRSSPAT